MSNFIDPTWKYHNNIEYIHIDFSATRNDEDAIDLVAAAVNKSMNRPDKSIRALILNKGKRITPSAMRIIKKTGKEVQPKMKKSAIVGSVGLLTLLLKIYIAYTGSNMKFFTNVKSALNYITSD